MGALADLCAARQQNCRAVGVKPHACRRSARRRRAFDGDGQSFATDKRSGGYCRLFFVIAPTDSFGCLAYAFRNSHGDHRFPGDEWIAFFEQILETQFERVHADAARDLVHLRLIRPADVGRTDAAIGSCRRKISVDRIGGVITMRNIVRAAGDDTGIFRICRSRKCVGAHVVPCFNFARP